MLALCSPPCLFQSIGLLLGIACMDFRKAMTIATIFMMAIMLLGNLMFGLSFAFFVDAFLNMMGVGGERFV